MQNYKNLKKIGKKTKERQDPPPRSLELQIKNIEIQQQKIQQRKQGKQKNEEKNNDKRR